jgi:hypothetical protein
MKINKIVVFPLVISFVGLLAFIAIPKKVIPPPSTNTPIHQTTSVSVVQKIIFGPNDPIDMQSIVVDEGDSVLDLLLKTKNPEIKEYSFGKAVESINGITNGWNKKYWLYSVNGKEANVGAADFKLAQNDVVTWEFK